MDRHSLVRIYTRRDLAMLICDRPCEKGRIHTSDTKSLESLDIATSNSASGGFISVSVVKLRHL